jgi:hypothetical protein
MMVHGSVVMMEHMFISPDTTRCATTSSCPIGISVR